MLGTGYLPHRAISPINYIPKHSENQIGDVVEDISWKDMIYIPPSARTSIYSLVSVSWYLRAYGGRAPSGNVPTLYPVCAENSDPSIVP